MKTLRLLAAAMVGTGSVPLAAGHDFHVGGIGVDAARAAPSSAGQLEDPAFLTITNKGKGDLLVGATCKVAASVQLRAAIPAPEGLQERAVEAIPVPADSTLELKRQGYHLAFISLNYSFVPGERIAATLRFASGAELPVEFQVQEESAVDRTAAQSQ